MKEKIICGIQQVGIGVKDLFESWKWYNETLGFELKIFDDDGVAERMLPYTGGKPQPRRAILALNKRGGGGFEIWQPKGREVVYPKTPLRIGDYGINICKIKAKDINKAYSFLQGHNVDILSKVAVSPFGIQHFYIKDPWDNIFEIERDNYVFINADRATGGVNGVCIGVDDMEKSIEFYGKLLDFDTVVGDFTDTFSDLRELNGGNCKVRRVMLKRSKPLQGPFSELIGTSHIELVKNYDIEAKKTLDGRFWGDPGFIHLCFDIRNMDLIREAAEALGKPFVCDSGGGFGMGDTNGHFTYVEDPSGTLIEFVETFKVPIVKKLGIVIDLKAKDDYKPLCRLVTKALKFTAVKPEKIKL